jgi:hypothetical protein
MRRAIHLLGRLYPRRWRARYGDEFDTLLDDSDAGWRTLADVGWGAIKMQFTDWGFWRTTTVAAIAGLAVALGIAFALPEHFVSRAVLTFEGDDSRSAYAYLREIKDGLERRENLVRIADNFGLYVNERKGVPLDDVLDRMKKAISFRLMASPTTAQLPKAFVVDFDYPNAAVAQSVVNDLTATIVDEYLRIARNEDPPTRMRLRMVDPASLPARPTRPNRAIIGSAGLIGGALAGMVAVVARRRRKSHGMWPNTPAAN